MYMYVHVARNVHVARQRLGNSSLFTPFQVASGLRIAFSTSLEGPVIEIKPAAPAPVDTAVSLKAKFRHNF